MATCTNETLNYAPERGLPKNPRNQEAKYMPFVPANTEIEKLEA